MGDCHRLDPLVTPYVDGELDAAGRRRVDEHVGACPPCRSRVAAERVVRDLIGAHRPALGARCAPPSLRARCARAARLKPRLSARLASALRVSRGRAAGVAIAASLVLVAGAALVYQLTDSSARVMAAELAADHMKCFVMNSVLGTRGMAAEVETEMVAGFGWRAHLPEDATALGLELVGSRPCLYGEGKVAHIMYRHRGRPVSLFMLPNTARAQQLVEVLGHEAAIWCSGSRTFVLVAREPPQDVQRLASYVQASLR